MPVSREERIKLIDLVWKYITSAARNRAQWDLKISMILGARKNYESKTLERKAKIARMLTGGVMRLGDIPHLAKKIFVADWVKMTPEMTKKLLGCTPTTVLENSSLLTALLNTMAGMVARGEATFLDFMDTYKACATPLAWNIVVNIIGLLTMAGLTDIEEAIISNPGTRVMIAAPLGGGKTTFTLWSIIAALTALGVPTELAMEYARAFTVNNLREFLDILEIASTYSIEKGRVIPVVVLDDAAKLLSKYISTPLTATRVELRLMRAIVELLQISREGLGVVAFATSHPEILVKGIRETTDILIRGIPVKRSHATYTIWCELVSAPVVRGAKISQLVGTQSTREASEGRYIVSMTATIHPPMWAPKKIYHELQINKIMLRRETVEMLKKAVEKLEEEIEETEEEGIPEEELEEEEAEEET